MVAATSGLAFKIAESATVIMTTLRLPSGGSRLPWTAVSCLVLAAGGQTAPICIDTGPGSVNVAGSLSISTQQVVTSRTSDCESSPCQNGGVCSDDVNGYTCSCADEYYGPMCATEHECLSIQSMQERWGL